MRRLHKLIGARTVIPGRDLSEAESSSPESRHVQRKTAWDSGLGFAAFGAVSAPE
jgi:hypothetical protein